ncbi:MAG: hypothetical protein JO271_15520 [Verrucomicrobia bacterium]|nr:hypothetical protein [Verrucomicrobiota bacterium]MBV9272383.1 hypothetical protein [Verrucomicrobiota bacterium]
MIFQLQESIQKLASRRRRLLELTNRLEQSLYWFMSAIALGTVGILCLEEVGVRQKHPPRPEHSQVAGLYERSARLSDGLTARVFSALSDPKH